ncbi:chorismate--pyruvate lyase family protein [Kineococcus sp. SYSU DK005]|uniref:chorismate--pyruvate lyase family protein n=1 Tax=Kineococcus sp. SYSU DK005 TaxID=3383126 RepID=UPI003D7C501F
MDQTVANAAAAHPVRPHPERHSELPGDELAALTPAGRMVMTTDGTVTAILAHAVGERIVLGGTEQHLLAVAAPAAGHLRLPVGAPVELRTVQLVGERTGTRYVRAETVVSTAALPPAFREDLARGAETIGRLLRAHRLETYREVVDVQVAEAEGTCRRTYTVSAGGVPVLLITEHFEATCRFLPVGLPAQARRGAARAATGPA